MAGAYPATRDRSEFPIQIRWGRLGASQFESQPSILPAGKQAECWFALEGGVLTRAPATRGLDEEQVRSLRVLLLDVSDSRAGADLTSADACFSSLQCGASPERFPRRPIVAQRRSGLEVVGGGLADPR